MRVKIKEPGWEGFTGDLGTVQFKDGVSIENIPVREAYALGAFVSVVELEDDGREGNPVSPAYDLVRNQSLTASVEEPRRRLSEILEEEAAASITEEPAAEPLQKYTKEELEAIAEAKGIAGLREIGDRHGIKNNSIRGLIAELLPVVGA